MNKFVKKVAVGIIAASMFFSSITYGIAQGPVTIHERKWSENISSGVIHEHIQKFTSEGWLNINILKVDLDDKYTEIGALFSNKGISTRERLTTMITNSKAVAGINGDFFSTSGKPYPLGAVVSEGKLVSTPAVPSQQLPVFAVDEDNNPFISFWQWSINAIPEAGQPIYVASINKDDPLCYVVRMYDRNWSLKTIGNTLGEDLVEVIVIDSKVAEIRMGQEPIDMPENGYILVGRGNAKNTLLNNFKVGDEVTLQINTTPSLENIKAAIGAGTLLVKDGKMANFSLNIEGTHPRTALGITKDKKHLIMVTVDGRHTSFKGVSQETLAQIMIELGAYEAINLDGGGSTTMAVFPPGEDSPRIVNNPSDGSERTIVNGIGVFSNAPNMSLNYIKVFTDDTNMFTNTTRSFYIKGYDKYHNPVDVELEDAVFSIEGIKGQFKGNVLTALEPGKGTVKVKYKRKSAEIQINVLNKVKDIEIEKDRIHGDVENQISLGNIYGINDEGYTAKIEPSDIEWKVTGNIGTVKDGVLYTGKKPASGAITALLGDAVENILVSVGYTDVVLEDFEDISNLTFAAYPQTVEGSIERDTNEKEGNYSLQLNYDFTKDDATRAAYIILGSNGITLKDKPDKIGVWIYGNKSGHWVRGNLKDSTGKVHKIDFTNSIDWKGWNWITANIPSNISYPVILERIYVVETNPLNKDKGKILFDGLKALYSTPYENMVLPAESVVTDRLNRHSEIQEGGYKFVVANGIENLNNLLMYHISNKIKDVINNTDLGILTGKMNSKFAEKISKPKMQITSGYNVLSHKNALFIQLDDTNNGIRPTNYQQWFWLKDRLQNAIERNIFILMPRPIWGQKGFTDKLEADLFHETLCEYKDKGKNIWVIHGGNKTDVTLKSGIRYIEFNNQQITNNVDIFSLKHIVFTVNGNEITYEILPLFKQ